MATMVLMRLIPSCLLCLACLLLLAQAPAVAADSADPRFSGLVDRLQKDGLDRSLLDSVFSDPRLAYDPDSLGKKMRTLYRSRYVPAKHKPKRTDITIWDTHLSSENLEAIASFQREHQSVLDKAQKKYGVSAKIIVAILAMETELGNFLGDQPALANLASMAAGADYSDLKPYLAEYQVTPKQRVWLDERAKEKSDWAYEELKALLEYARINKLDPAGLKGSIYGAIGLCQFMPSNALRLGVDSDGDDCVDLYQVPDAVHSIGNFLKKKGWKDSLSYKKKIGVLKRYNPDTFYAQVVLAIAKRI